MAQELNKGDLKKYLSWAIITALIVLTFLTIKQFIIPLLSAFILAYLALPLYNKLNKKINSNLSAIICIFLIILIIIIPLILILGELLNQLSLFLQEDTVNNFLTQASEMPLLDQLSLDLNKITQEVVSFSIQILKSTLKEIPSILISLIIITFGIFYSLKNWEILTKKLKQYIPYKDKDKIAKDISEATKNIIYGSIIIALIELVVALIGFYLIGIKFAFIFASLVFILSFIPGLGPTIVWTPLAIYYFIFGSIWQAMALIFLGAILSFGIDAILRGKIVGDKSNMNPLIMLIGILGGISMFGIFGFIIGPLILVYTIEILQEIIENKR